MNLESVQMTSDEKAEYSAFLNEKAKKAEKARIKKEREIYKEIKDSTIRTNFELLKEVSGLMIEAKNTIFGIRVH